MLGPVTTTVVAGAHILMSPPRSSPRPRLIVTCRLWRAACLTPFDRRAVSEWRPSTGYTQLHLFTSAKMLTKWLAKECAHIWHTREGTVAVVRHRPHARAASSRATVSLDRAASRTVTTRIMHLCAIRRHFTGVTTLACVSPCVSPCTICTMCPTCPTHWCGILCEARRGYRS